MTTPPLGAGQSPEANLQLELASAAGAGPPQSTPSISAVAYHHPDPLDVRREEARLLLTAIVAGQPGHLVLSTFNPVVSHSFTEGTIEDATTYALEGSDTQCVYFGTGLRDAPFDGPGPRGTIEDISSIALLWTEVDWLDQAHKKGGDKLPADRSAAMAIIDAFRLTPTGIIDSGHGLHVYWALKQPLVISDEASRERAITFVREFQYAFNSAAYENGGYVLDSTSDIARVLRVPGTVNRKIPTDPMPVRTVSWDNNIHYQQADIPLRSSGGSKASGGGKRHGKKKNKTAKADEQYGPADLMQILGGCAFMAHARDDAAELTRSDWFIAAGIAGRCVDGKQGFHELSKPYPGYNKNETEKLLQDALVAGPTMCSTIESKLGSRYCGTCPFRGGIATPLELGRSDERRPIDIAFGDLPEHAAKAWAAVYQQNNPPTLYRLVRGLARLDRDGAGVLSPTALTPDHLTHRVARVAPWLRTLRDITKGVTPPIAVVRDMLVQPSVPLPLLRGVTQVPVFSTDGDLHQTPGYSPTTKRFYDPAIVKVPPVPDHPSPAQLRAAVDLLLHEFLGDFPFDGDSDRAHAIAIALLPFGRDFIVGPTPLHIIDKPIHGTGATLLAKVLLIPACGSSVLMRTQASGEEEWRKALTSALKDMPGAVIFDNLSGNINSAALSSALTDDTWSDRLLGTNTNVTVAVQAVFVATANNVRLSGELSRRSIPIRLDAKTDRPWQRTGTFKHPALQAWATEQRSALVMALLTLWSAWISQGRPAGNQPLGSYESWAAVMGGVLDVAGIPGFLKNLDKLYERADSGLAEELEFVNAWWIANGERELPVRDLVHMALNASIPLALREDQNAATLGTLLRTLVGRCYRVENHGGNEITVVVTQTVGKKRQNLWKLILA